MSSTIDIKNRQEVRFIIDISEDTYCNNTFKRKFENLQTMYEIALMDIEGLKRENFLLKDRCKKLENVLVETIIK